VESGRLRERREGKGSPDTQAPWCGATMFRRCASLFLCLGTSLVMGFAPPTSMVAHAPMRRYAAQARPMVSATVPGHAAIYRPKLEQRVSSAPVMGLFGLGWGEIGVIAVVGLFLVGPDKITALAKEAGGILQHLLHHIGSALTTAPDRCAGQVSLLLASRRSSMIKRMELCKESQEASQRSPSRSKKGSRKRKRASPPMVVIRPSSQLQPTILSRLRT
jgi:hypothetical protein